MTPLDKSLKRALNIKGRDYVIRLDPQALKITEKGRRIGLQLKWADIVSGESALAVALRASLGKFQSAPRAVAGKVIETPRSARRPKATSRPSRFTKSRAAKRP